MTCNNGCYWGRSACINGIEDEDNAGLLALPAEASLSSNKREMAIPRRLQATRHDRGLCVDRQ